MSKTETIKLDNWKIANQFLKTIKEPNYRINIESSLRLFLDMWNHTSKTKKPEYVEWNYDKNVSKITLVDLMDFFDMLNLDSENWSIRTKRTRITHVKKFAKYILKRFSEKFKPIERLEFKAEINDNDNWKFAKKGHKQPETYYRDNVMTKEELDLVITYLYDHDKQKYYIFRILAETGMRKTELIKISLTRNYRGKLISLEEDLKGRRLVVVGKMREGDKYVISKQLADQLLTYLKNTRINPEYINKYHINTNAFFVSQMGRRFNHTTLNYSLMGVKYSKRDIDVLIKKYGKTEHKMGELKRKGIIQRAGIDKHITPHSFRKTLNTLRKKEGCSDGDLEYLLNHKISVNRDNYIKLTWKERIELYDRYYPYKKMFRDLI